MSKETKMIAFHGDKKIKALYLNRVKAHEKADEIIKGVYWENGKGCAVGCTVHSNQHSAYEDELGIPRALARIEDGIFESLPNDLAKTWPKRFLQAIKPGADLKNVLPQFMLWLLVDGEHGVIKFARNDQQKEAIQSIADLYVLKLEGVIVDVSDWMEARSAAYAAADAASYAAADDASSYAASYAAYAAAADAASSYAAAADAASSYAAADDASSYAAYASSYAASRQEARIAQSEKLIELLRAAR